MTRLYPCCIEVSNGDKISSFRVRKSNSRRMNIAILGTRGIPARYGGFETFAEHLAKRLVARGHTVSVYCRRPFTKSDDVFDSRIRRVILPGTSSKHFDTLINYGAEVPAGGSNGLSAQLPEERYFLYVSRLEPENNPELVLQAYQRVSTDWPLVILGSNAYRPEYVKQLRSLADDRVLFPGAIYGDGYWVLVKNAGVSVYA